MGHCRESDMWQMDRNKALLVKGHVTWRTDGPGCLTRSVLGRGCGQAGDIPGAGLARAGGQPLTSPPEEWGPEAPHVGARALLAVGPRALPLPLGAPPEGRPWPSGTILSST